jgi:hypothetical protein
MGYGGTSYVGEYAANYLLGMVIQNNDYAKVTALEAYTLNGGSSIIGAIYGADTVNGVPTTLIASTVESPGYTTQWSTMSLASPVTLPPGSYWLVVICNTNYTLVANNGIQADWNIYTENALASGGFPTSLGTTAWNGYPTGNASEYLLQALWTCP